jgi:signal transduction histidine kinase
VPASAHQHAVDKYSARPDSPAGARRGRPGRLVIVLGGIALLAVGMVADELLVGELPTRWRSEAIFGVFLLAISALFGVIIFLRSWRELQAAQQLLEFATGRLANANESLLNANRSLRETADQRDQALHHLRNAVRERDAFLAAVSHDLKTPLTVIKGHAELLSAYVKERSELDAVRIGSGLARVSKSAELMTNLVDQLLWLAQLEMDQSIDLELTAVDLVALARRTVHEYQSTTALHTLTYAANVPRLEGCWDERRLESIVANLVSNGIKYSPKGGDVRVGVALDELTHSAVLSVSDSGLGIPEGDVSHVFDRFYRAGNVGDQIVGTGVGLAGVRNAVEAHGGTVEVESREGKGSTFTVRLPIGNLPGSCGPAEA